MLFMILRFLRTRTSVKHALIDLKKDSLYPTKDEIEILEEIVGALETVEGASRQLCRRDISIAEADQVPHIKMIFKNHFFSLPLSPCIF